MSSPQRLIKEWPWAETMIGAALVLAAWFVLAPYLFTYAGWPLPADTTIDQVRTLLTALVAAAVAQVVGERATWKKDAAEFKAAARAEQSEGAP